MFSLDVKSEVSPAPHLAAGTEPALWRSAHCSSHASRTAGTAVCLSCCRAGHTLCPRWLRVCRTGHLQHRFRPQTPLQGNPKYQNISLQRFPPADISTTTFSSAQHPWQNRSGHMAAHCHGWCDLGSCHPTVPVHRQGMCSTAPTRWEGRKPPPKPARLRAAPSLTAELSWTDPALLH